MKYVIDIDGVLCDTTYQFTDENWYYIKSKPKQVVIDKVNSLYDSGHRIVLFTARGSKIKRDDWKELTIQDLNEWDVRYHELLFGKPWADYYVDDKNMSVERFLDMG